MDLYRRHTDQNERQRETITNINLSYPSNNFHFLVFLSGNNPRLKLYEDDYQWATRPFNLIYAMVTFGNRFSINETRLLEILNLCSSSKQIPSNCSTTLLNITYAAESEKHKKINFQNEL